MDFLIWTPVLLLTILHWRHHVWPLATAHVRLHDDIVASLGPAGPEHILLQGKVPLG